MTDAEHKRRDNEARDALRDIGELPRARQWLKKNPPPRSWKGTPFEYALEEMPVGVIGEVFDALL